MVPFWIPIIIRHLIFRVPKKDHNFDKRPDRIQDAETKVPAVNQIFPKPLGGSENLIPYIDPL